MFSNKKVLFVTAHPDDETLFFGSLINKLGNNSHILCLSNGNYKKNGNLREKELIEACKIYRCDKNVTILCDIFEDNPTELWNPYLISKYIHNSVINYNIDIIITFDEYGISNHLNHISCYFGVEYYLKYVSNSNIEVYKLVTLNKFYFLPFTFLIGFIKIYLEKCNNSHLFIFLNTFNVTRAFLKYKTQYHIQYNNTFNSIINCIMYFSYVLFGSTQYLILLKKMV